MKMNRLIFRTNRKQKSKNAARARRSALAGSIAVLAASVLSLGTPSNASAANLFWDPFFTGTATGGGAGTWDELNLANWWDPIALADVQWNNANLDIAFFGGTAGGLVTLGSGITAGGLTFTTSGYRVTGGTLTLAAPAGSSSPVITVKGIELTTISSIVAGTSGFTKMGNGSLVLTNNANSFTGDLSIKEGNLVITNAAQLGAGTTAISITGIANTGNPGFSGGSLVLNGVGGGITLNREVSVSGRGPGAANASGGLISLGYNTIAGGLTIGAGASEGRVVATHGITTVSGGVNLGAGAAQLFYGNGNWIVSGVVTGNEAANDRLIKTANTVSTTLWLQNTNNNFAQSLRIDSGTVRVQSGGALGNSVTTQAMDFNGGLLEVRTDVANTFSTRNVNIRGNTGTIFVDHDLGSSLLNQDVVFGGLNNSATNGTIAMSGRNGYNVTVGTGATMTWQTGGNFSISNTGSSGTLTINANINRASETNARTLTITASGEIVLTGNILQAGTGAVGLSENNTGMLTLQGAGNSTATGATTINAGTITIRSFSQLPSGTLNIGNAGTTSGALNYVGAGQTDGGTINLNTTTANVYINANGTGALILTGTINGVAGAKTLVLGGAGTGVNEIQSAIPLNATNLQKVGAGTWQLSGANLFTGSTTVAGGTLNIQDTFAGSSRNVLANAGAVLLNVDAFTQSAGGTFNYLGASGAASAETVGALTLTAGHGTIQASPTGGGSATLTFASLGTRTVGSTVNVLNTGVVQIGGTAAFVNAGVYFNGSDFAYSGAGTTLRAPVYDTDGGFVTAGAGLTATSHNLVAANTSTGALTISSLNIVGGQTVAQTGLLTIQTAANSPGGIIQAGGSGIISGTGVTTGGTGDLVIRVNGGGDQLTMTAPITATTTGGLTKNGAGLLLLQGAQAYLGGATTINEGTLRIDTGSRLGGASASNNNNLAIRQDGTLDIFGNTIGVGAFNGAGSVTNSSGTFATLTIGNNNQSGYFTGVISGNMGVTKAGTGTGMSLTGLNTFTGPLTLSTGTLAVNNLANIGFASAIGKGDDSNDITNAASLVFNGGTLLYQGANGVISQNTQTPSVDINRLFTLAANGVIDSSPSFGTPVLARVNNNAALVFSNPGAVAFTGAGVRTLTLQGDSLGDNTMGLQLINNTNAGEALSVTKLGTGLWILSNTGNSYSGNTTVSGNGVLQVGDDSSALTRTLPTTSALVLGVTTTTGILQTSGSFTRDLAATATANKVTFGGTTGGGGFAASTGRLTVDFGGAGGTVQWGAGGFVGTGGIQTLILSSTTALSDVTIVNPIDLNVTAGTVVRTVQVDDNPNTGFDYATLAGVISNSGAGTAALTKTGGGNLILGDANTYNGDTSHTAGNLFVTSIGGAGATSSSLGTNVGGGILSLGNGGTGAPNLLYVGPGETATRDITLNSTTGTITLDASGGGALVLANVITNGAAGAKTLQLRGSNTDVNVLANTTALANNGGNLTITKVDGGSWALAPSVANTFTGNINANGGLLGLTSNGIGAAPNIVISNGGIFAFGAPLTTSTPVTLANNSAAVFGGRYGITLDGNVTKAAGVNDQTFSNNLEGGAVLTVNGNYINLETAVGTRILSVRGFGSTVWNGEIRNRAGSATSLTRLDIRISDDASFTIAGDNKGGTDGFTGGLLLGQGTLIVGHAGALGPVGNVLIMDGGTFTSTVDLTGANAIGNRFSLQGDQITVNGSQNIEITGQFDSTGGNRFLRNDLDAGKSLTISGLFKISGDTNARTLTLRGSGETIITGVISNGSTAASNLQYSGLNVLILTTANTATGALTVNRNTVILTSAGPTGGAWNLGTVTVNPIGILRLDNTAGNTTGGTLSDRLSDTLTFTGQGGTLDIIGAVGGTDENVGPLTLNSVQTFITLTDNSGGPGNNLTFASVNFANSGSSLNLAGVPALGTTNKVKFTAAPSGAAIVINGIIPRIFIGGTDFAKYDVANGVVALVPGDYNLGNNLNTAAATDTVGLTASSSLTAFRTINALKLNGTALSAGGSVGTRLTITSGGIINTGGNNTLDMASVSFTNTPIIQVSTGTTLAVNAGLIGAVNFIKSLPGTLQLNTPSFMTGTHNILNGVLKLNGGLNTLFPNQLTNINDGATLDLNGNVQLVGSSPTPASFPRRAGSSPAAPAPARSWPTAAPAPRSPPISTAASFSARLAATRSRWKA